MAATRSTARKAGRATFLDANVLIDATDVRRQRHRATIQLLGQGVDLFFSAQIVREYLVVASRPAGSNGWGWRSIARCRT